MKRTSLVFAALLLMMITSALTLNAAPIRAQNPTATPTIEPTPLGVSGVTMLSNGFSMTSVVSSERYDDPKLYVQVSQPQLGGGEGDDAVQKADTFNAAVAEVVKSAVYDFRDQLITEAATSTPIPEIADFESFALLGFYTSYTRDGLVSLRFEIATYAAGAAHPLTIYRSLTFDLVSGKVVELADLFKPASDYLKFISDFATADLKTRDLLLFPEGALPTADNYAVWTLTSEGLMITFNVYQVMPYAAGPQSVTIPYEELAAIRAEDGLLARIG
ncbi:MAG: DUF3298 domain-containing protein [Anaerolineae bacterium]|nr:DUF3298 domain-containing protein [Anaerolineae bacterium]